MDDALFDELLDATREAVAHHRGQKADLRTTVLPERPRQMSAFQVKRLRGRLHMSQAVFAHYLNVSPKLVQAWEGGARTPDGPALMLLRLGERSPGTVFPTTETPSISEERHRPMPRSTHRSEAAHRETHAGSRSGTRSARKRVA